MALVEFIYGSRANVEGEHLRLEYVLKVAAPTSRVLHETADLLVAVL